MDNQGVVAVFGARRALSTRTATCFVCRTVCNPGRAAIVPHAVICAGCKLAGRGVDVTVAPAGWRSPIAFGVDGAPVFAQTIVLGEPASVVLTYTPPVGQTVERAVMAREIDALRANIVALAGPKKAARIIAPPSPEASEAGRALAACRKPSDRKRARAALAAK